MSLTVKVQGLFNPKSIALTMERLPKLASTFIDTLFPGTVEHPSVGISLAELETVAGTQPLATRQGQPIPLAGQGQAANLWVPRPLKPSIRVAAADLNDLSLIWGDKLTVDNFVSREVDKLRRLVRNTTEAIASVVATSGKLVWPSRLDSGAVETYELKLGEVRRTDPPVKWDDAATPPQLEDVYEYLSDLEQAVAESGGGGGLKFMAGKKAFKALIKLARLWQSTAQGGPISLTLGEGAVNIGGYAVKQMVERYQDPISGAWVSKLAENSLLGYATDTAGKVFYLAVDSISGSNRPTPFHIVAKENDDDSAINLIAQAKPLPVRDARTLIKGQVTG